MMYNDIRTRDFQLIFFPTAAVQKRTSGFHSRFRYLSSSLGSSSLHVRYLHAKFATSSYHSMLTL